LHEHSSRSHTIFRVFIQKTIASVNQSSDEKQVFYSTLNLVDLAGSERLYDNDVKQDVQDETAHINKSLFTLSLVINKLAEGNASHVPYRDSKLTRIL
jgi:centromeric protein E